MLGRVPRGAPPWDSLAHWTPSDAFHTVEAGAHCRQDARVDIGLHEHDFVEVSVVAEGAARHYVNGRWREMVVGDVFVFPVGAIHAYERRGRARVYNLIFQRAFFARQVAPIGPVLPLPDAASWAAGHSARGVGPPEAIELSLPPAACGDLFALLERTRLEGLSAGPADRAATEWLALYTLARVVRAGTADNEQPAALAAPAAALPVVRALEHMRRHYAGPISSADLTRAAGVSATHLRRLFARSIGMSPKRYLAEVRVQAARALLARRDYTLTVIAQETGFFDSAHFARTFTKLVGVSPATYRRALPTRSARGGR